jgi:FO synthase subunit 2
MTVGRIQVFLKMSTIDAILNRAIAGADLTPTEGVTLLHQSKPGAVEAIRQAADQMRSQLVGPIVTYVINRNLNFTNICEQHCSFCAFRRDPDQPGAYWLTEAEILAKASDGVARGATELCIQGGLHPGAKRQGRSLDYYCHLVSTLKQAFPDLHLHAFSPQEVAFIAREDHLDWVTVIGALHDAGVDSMPGTAAEVLEDSVRQILCPEKISRQAWLEIVATAHRLGLPTTSTMLCGHIETPEHQIAHLDQLRSLQRTSLNQRSAAISEFILLPYVGETAPKALRRRVGRDQPILSDVLRLTAVARLYLGSWIQHHQPSWVKLGLAGAQQALAWGCDDLGGTLMEEHITSMAGAKGGTHCSEEMLQGAIAQLGRPWKQRSTLYQSLEDVGGTSPEKISEAQ